MPLRQASRKLEELLGVSIRPETAPRQCEAVGRRVEKQQPVEARDPWNEATDARENACRMAISADGAIFPLTGGAPAAVRRLSIRRFRLALWIQRRFLPGIARLALA